MAERALELLALPDDGLPRLILDIGILSFAYVFAVQIQIIPVVLMDLMSVWYRMWVWT